MQDICIVTQDLDFPHFENSVELKMLGTNIAFEGCLLVKAFRLLCIVFVKDALGFPKLDAASKGIRV